MASICSLSCASTGTAPRVRAASWVQTLDGKDRRALVNGGSDPRVLAAGPLVYIHDGVLLAVPFDQKRLAVTGGPVPVVQGVTETQTTSAGQFAVSSSGTLVFEPGSADSLNARRTLIWVDRGGHEQAIPVKPRAYEFPRLSPDGKKIAVSSQDEEHDVWIFDIEKETLTRVSSGPLLNTAPSGDRIADIFSLPPVRELSRMRESA
jgi:hypothetical protein